MNHVFKPNNEIKIMDLGRLTTLWAGQSFFDRPEYVFSLFLPRTKYGVKKEKKQILLGGESRLKRDETPPFYFIFLKGLLGRIIS
jgi:hypothetical protein